MNNFDAKWQMCAERARQADLGEDSAPFGFAARVAARFYVPASGPLPLELVWERLAARCLGCLAAVLVLCAAVELPRFRDRKALEPGIENTVAQLVWSL